MKKLILLLSFVFVLGLVSVEAGNNNSVVKRTPPKTEQTAKKTAKSHKSGKKVKKGTKAGKTAKTTKTAKKPANH